MEEVKLIECPRDAMQGIHEFIPTEMKAEYINLLLNVGFDTIDFGSFVSPKAIPQMKDTAEVLKRLNLADKRSNLLAIIANERGARDAASFDEIDFLGYPFSISETFQRRNTNTSIEGSMKRLETIHSIAQNNGKKVLVYLSMGFGNPYGDPWNEDIIIHWANKLKEKLGIQYMALADTVGVATPALISTILNDVLPEFTSIEMGVHLHTTPETYHEKIKTAYDAGCRKFDGVIRGFGGCPMAEDELVGNMPTEKMIQWFTENNIATNINEEKLALAIQKSTLIFN